jgi:hypothetical protein
MMPLHCLSFIHASPSAMARTSAIVCWTLCRRQSLGAFSSVNDNISARRGPAALGELAVSATRFGNVNAMVALANLIG